MVRGLASSDWSPLLIVGAARSGTTLLAEQVLAAHPDLTYWGEPDHVWKHGHAYRRTDVLTAEDATGTIKQYIRRRFQEKLQSGEGRRLLTKSPRNSLQMPFVLKIFPNAQFVHVVRDGRDAALSASREWRGEAGTALDSRDIRRLPRLARLFRTLFRDVKLSERIASVRDLLELPAYVPRLAGLVVRQLIGASRLPWGPRFPGVREVRRHFSLLETCMVQWCWSVGGILGARHDLASSQYLEVRYEDLVAGPKGEIRKILDFAELERADDIVNRIASVVQPRTLPKWPEKLDTGQVATLERIGFALLSNLSYNVRIGNRE